MAKKTVQVETGAPQVEKFDTFLGVYTPSLLTILGLIVYLRSGWVPGNLGPALTIFTVLLASAITFMTALSASAVATNMQVGVGGEYYMISRSFGLELGGAIGIPLLAYLLRLNPEWNDARIMVRSIVDSEEERDPMAGSPEVLMQHVRIQAETQIIVRRAGRIVSDILKAHSGNADVVLLGLMDAKPGSEEEYADRLAELASGLHTTIFIRNAGSFAGRLV
jgi:hypothetical protein